MARYSLVMSQPGNLPPQPPAQKTAAGAAIPVPTRSGFFDVLRRVVRRDRDGDRG